jgi:hypothetical protein
MQRPKLNKDGSIRKKPGRKPRIQVEHLTTFPSLTLRQTSILLTIVAASLPLDVVVDGELVTPEEWVNLTAALARGFK